MSTIPNGCWVSAALLVLFLGACDSQVSYDQDSTESDPESPFQDSADDRPDSSHVPPDSSHIPPDSSYANFLQMEVGDKWIYDFYYSHLFSGSYFELTRDSGLVHLSVVARECPETTCIYKLQLELHTTRTEWTDGLPDNDTTVTEIDLVRTIQAVELEDGRIQHPFFSQPIERFHSADSDTVVVKKATRTQLDASQGGLGNWLVLTLAREQGIVEARFSWTGSGSVSSTGWLRLTHDE